MYISKIVPLGVVVALFDTVAKADVAAPSMADQGAFEAVTASMPVEPSIVFFVGGIVGLAFLARRKARKTTQLY